MPIPCIGKAGGLPRVIEAFVSVNDGGTIVFDKNVPAVIPIILTFVPSALTTNFAADTVFDPVSIDTASKNVSFVCRITDEGLNDSVVDGAA